MLYIFKHIAMSVWWVCCLLTFMVFVCVCVRHARVHACVRACVCVCMRVCFARVYFCMCLPRPDIIIAIINASHTIITRWVDSHFLRIFFAFSVWLTAFHVINNNCSADVPLPNKFLYCSPTEEDEGNFYLILISLFWIPLQLISPPLNSMGCVLWRWMVINILGDGRLLKMRDNYSTSRKVRT